MITNINTSKITINHHFDKKPSFFNNQLISISFESYKCTKRPKWALQCETTKNENSSGEVISILKEEEEGKRRVFRKVIEEREVSCEVEVVSWRESRIKAEISVFADIQSVWDVLTDYDRLAEFIPNLVYCKRVPCPHPGGIWLEQRGLQRALYWKIEALVLLNLQEFLNSEDERQIHFSLVEGDFEKFEGKWSLKSDMRSQGTTLSYEVTVVPKIKIPAIILEKVIGAELPVNVLAVACRAESR